MEPNQDAKIECDYPAPYFYGYTGFSSINNSLNQVQTPDASDTRRLSNLRWSIYFLPLLHLILVLPGIIKKQINLQGTYAYTCKIIILRYALRSTCKMQMHMQTIAIKYSVALSDVF